MDMVGDAKWRTGSHAHRQRTWRVLLALPFESCISSSRTRIPPWRLDERSVRKRLRRSNLSVEIF
eukprot:25786-Pelagococcus_subviridis.AAC.1